MATMLRADKQGALSSTDNHSQEMVWIPGGTFRMGSDKHYPEEAPSHRVSVDGFWMDRTPVTNRQFKQFVMATGHLTTAEIPRDPKDCSPALAYTLSVGSLVFTRPRSTFDLCDWSQWWSFTASADWRHPYGPRSDVILLDDYPVVHVSFFDALAYATLGRQGVADGSGMGIRRPRWTRKRRIAWGDEFARAAAHGKHLAGGLSAPRSQQCPTAPPR